ncbi:CPBP family intramembrane metalloprotease [Candidatus Gracilibacteria bacterium]|nr:CPBP family intramembrane metalloprotease [Candidatus Gracilibacteria bacterium]
MSAVVFGAVHGHPTIGVIAGLLGVTLAIIYERSRSLTACIVVHAVFNTLGIALIYIIGDGIRVKGLCVGAMLTAASPRSVSHRSTFSSVCCILVQFKEEELWDDMLQVGRWWRSASSTQCWLSTNSGSRCGSTLRSGYWWGRD